MNKPTQLCTVLLDGKTLSAGVSRGEAFEAQAKFGPRVQVKPFEEHDKLFERVYETLKRVEGGMATAKDAEFLDNVIRCFRFCLDEETNGFQEWDSMEGRQIFRALMSNFEWEDEA